MFWILACFSALVLQGTDQWDGFLGGRGGLTAAEAELPLEWSPGENRAWAVDLPGHGQSSPVVMGDKVFVTSTEGPEKDDYHLICLSTESGEKLWQTTIENSVPVKNSVYVSRSAPTPVVDQQRVVAFFESGDVLACSLDGKKLWQRNLNKDYGPFEAEFGLGASPCHLDEHVFVLLEHEGPSYLVALDKKTGETVWKTEREPRSSWASPAIVRVDGMPQVVVSSKGSVDGYDPGNGKLLWSFTEVDGNTGTTPIDLGEGRFLVGASGGRGPASPLSKISNGLMQVKKDGDGWKVERLWSADNASVSWASPIGYQGYAYWVNRVGAVQCFDLETGEEVYQERIAESCWATPLPVGDRIYFFGKSGKCTVVQAGQVFEKLATNETWTADEIKPDDLPEETDEQRRQGVAMFSAPTLYGYAVAGNSLLVRVGNRLICIRE